ncbi:MAG: hypothetical protein NDP13_04195 [Crenarchaeota archaeon]|nr:hypothetical protein [Thermoproteota archaeon]MCR8455813.1 hypothetical protein [Thermoproteota archaeon]
MVKRLSCVQLAILLVVLFQVITPLSTTKSQEIETNFSGDSPIIHIAQAANCRAIHTAYSETLDNAKSSEIPVVETKTLALYPLGEISDVHYAGDKFVIQGVDYIHINGTDRIFRTNEAILSVDYEDIDNDQEYELVVLTATKVYLLDSDLKIIWTLNHDGNYTEALFAMLTDPKPIIVLWKYNSGKIAYLSIDGESLNETVVMYAGSSAQLLDIDYSGKYLLGLVRYLDNNLILNWTYYNPVATRFASMAPCSPMVRLKDIVYSIGCVGTSCFVLKIINGSLTYFEMTDSIDWRTFIYSLRRFSCMDIDRDESVEFLVYNTTFLALIDTANDTSSVVGVYKISEYIDQAALYCEGVAMITGNDLKVYDKTLILREVFQVEAESILLESLDDIFTVSRRGSCLSIRGSDLLVSRPFLNAGWNYQIDKNTLVIYNAHHAVVFWMDYFVTFSTQKVILSAVAASDLAILVFDSDIVTIQRGGKIASINMNATNCLAADFDGSKIYIMRDNGTLDILTVSTGVVTRWNPPPGYKPVSIYSLGSYWIFSLIKNTTGYTEVAIYVNGNLARTIQISLQNSNVAGASVVAGDKDRDGKFEIACVVYARNATLHWNYTMCILENGSAIWSTPPRVFRASEWVFSVISLAGSYGFLNGTVVKRIFTDGSAEVISFDEQVNGGCESAVFGRSKIVALTSRGKATLNFDGCYGGLGRYGLFSSVLYINCSYYLKNLTLVLDLAPPKVVILSPNTGELFNQKTVKVAWKISDDLMVKNAELYLNGSFVSYIESEGELTLTNLAEGNYSVTIVARDHIDRVCENRTWFIVDIPLTLEVQAPNNTWQNTPAINVTIRIYGAADRVSIFRNATLVSSYQSNITISIELEIGINIIRIEASGYRDFSCKVFIIGFDPSPPVINLIEPQNNTVITTKEEKAQVNIVLDIEDLSGISKIILIYESFKVEISTNSILDLGVGEYYFIIGAYDLAGNYASIILHIIIERESVKSTSPLEFKNIPLFVSTLLLGIVLGIGLTHTRKRGRQ